MLSTSQRVPRTSSLTFDWRARDLYLRWLERCRIFGLKTEWPESKSACWKLEGSFWKASELWSMSTQKAFDRMAGVPRS